jgi:ubiquinone/menaquinone biosynthesis C-methylase UbiE
VKKQTRKLPDFRDEKIRKYILKRQKGEIWTPEQIESLSRHFKLKPGIKLLEVGCGMGLQLRNFGPYCLPRGELTGVCSNSNAVENVQKLADKEGLGEYSIFVEGDFYNLPFADNTFDFSLTHLLLSWCPDPEKIFDELVRVTKIGGCVAIFDNASQAGAESVWCNLVKKSFDDQLFQSEINQRMAKGAEKLKQGDSSIGCKIAGWMEERGFKDIDIRQCERVIWFAPPYKSPAQKPFLEFSKKRYEMMSKSPVVMLKSIESVLKAGGSTDAMIKRNLQMSVNEIRRINKGIKDGTIEMAFTGPLWVTWGFKAGKRK